MPLSESALLLMALLAIGVLVRGLFNKLPIPYTVMLVIVGMLLGNLARVWQPLESIQYFHLSPELVFFIFLPVLIFESGLSLHARQLAKDIIPVLMLAIPALLVSTTIVGVGVWVLLPLDLTTALLFGALISATDPVAVVSLFKELGTPTRLTTLVEGESLMNDATAIVLFSILLGLALHGGFVVTDIGAAILEFVRVFLGGTLLGLGFGLLLGRMVIRLRLETSSVLVSSLILAYVAFIVAEHSLHVSGVMAVVAAAISFSLIASPRLSEATGVSVDRHGGKPRCTGSHQRGYYTGGFAGDNGPGCQCLQFCTLDRQALQVAGSNHGRAPHHVVGWIKGWPGYRDCVIDSSGSARQRYIAQPDARCCPAFAIDQCPDHSSTDRKARSRSTLGG